MRELRESEVKFNIVRDIRKEGGYARRIEDRFSVGSPDLITIPLGSLVVWLEVKVVRGNLLEPEARQLVELKRLRIPPHSTTFLIGWKAGIHFISPPVDKIHIDDCIKQKPNERMGDFIRRAIDVEHLIERNGNEE